MQLLPQRAHAGPIRKRQAQKPHLLCGQYRDAAGAREVGVLFAVLCWRLLQPVSCGLASAARDPREAFEFIASFRIVPEGEALLLLHV